MSKLLNALERIFSGLARSVGILPFSYSFDRRKATVSTLWRCWSMGIFITITVLTPFNILNMYARMHFLKQHPLFAFVGFSRFVALYLCTIFTVITQLMNNGRLIYFCNEAAHTFREMRSIPCTVVGPTFDRRFILKLLVKLVSLWPITQMFVTLSFHEKAHRKGTMFMALLSIYYCQLVLIMTLNMFYCATIVLTAFTSDLNGRMQGILSEIRALKGQPCRANSLKMQKYCDLADVLDKMMYVYWKIASLGRIVNQHYQVQILCFLLYVSIEVVVQCYILYFVEAIASSRKADTYIMTPAVVIYILCWLMELASLVSAAHNFAEQFSKTKWILRTGTVTGSLDVRLERTVEHFSIYLNENKVSFTALGLFDIDRQCLFSIYQRLLALMLLLVQFDKILKSDALF